MERISSCENFGIEKPKWLIEIEKIVDAQSPMEINLINGGYFSERECRRFEEIVSFDFSNDLFAVALKIDQRIKDWVGLFFLKKIRLITLRVIETAYFLNVEKNFSHWHLENWKQKNFELVVELLFQLIYGNCGFEKDFFELRMKLTELLVMKDQLLCLFRLDFFEDRISLDNEILIKNGYFDAEILEVQSRLVKELSLVGMDDFISFVSFWVKNRVEFGGVFQCLLIKGLVSIDEKNLILGGDQIGDLTVFKYLDSGFNFVKTSLGDSVDIVKNYLDELPEDEKLFLNDKFKNIFSSFVSEDFFLALRLCEYDKSFGKLILDLYKLLGNGADFLMIFLSDFYEKLSKVENSSQRKDALRVFFRKIDIFVRKGGCGEGDIYGIESKKFEYGSLLGKVVLWGVLGLDEKKRNLDRFVGGEDILSDEDIFVVKQFIAHAYQNLHTNASRIAEKEFLDDLGNPNCIFSVIRQEGKLVGICKVRRNFPEVGQYYWGSLYVSKSYQRDYYLGRILQNEVLEDVMGQESGCKIWGEVVVENLAIMRHLDSGNFIVTGIRQKNSR